MSIDRNNKTAPTNKATQPSIIKETINIEPAMMGFVAGGKGYNLERLRKI